MYVLPQRICLGIALLVSACSARPALVLGNDCELATQCAAPLVCRLGHCRDECRLNRDCRAGLVCLRDAMGLGACELPEQDRCALSSDCDSPLICLMGHCSVACARDVDCPAGGTCVSDGAGGTGCRDPFMTRCEYDSECGNVLICAPDGVCREQCHTNRDCRDGLVCDRSMSPSVCGYPEDAGPIDAGADDGGSDGGTDTGVDAAAAGIDTGVDAGADAFASAPDMGVDAAVAMTGPAPIPLAVAGSDHVCATRTGDGQLRCWGANTYGQLGDSSVMRRTVATLVSPAIANVTILAAGIGHSCAYSTTAGLQCWGDDAAGQLGDGTPSAARNYAAPVIGTLTPTWLAAGHAHSCAVVGGSVRCWGANASGQLGDGGTTGRGTPMPTLALGGPVREVVARADWTCARLTDGRAQCWGDDRYGQLGVDIPGSMMSATPLFVAGVTGAVELTLGSSHGCARSAAGVVSCWGLRSSGRLGDGTTATGVRFAPAPTAAMPPAEQISAFGNHTCARAIDGDVYCWGDNFLGQCGQDGFARPTINAPARVSGVSGATEITAGDSHTCARVASGFVCWGANASGMLGDNSTTPHFAPAPVVWI